MFAWYHNAGQTLVYGAYNGYISITKTRLFKYIENFTTQKNENF